jgi:anti-anti-sigma factor
VNLRPVEFDPPPLDIETTTSKNALWVHLRGEADLGNHERLHAGLSHVRLEGAKAVHLVLTDLTFCDLCAFRHLVAFATRVQAAGRELTAHGACPSLKKIAVLLNVSHHLHFV